MTLSRIAVLILALASAGCVTPGGTAVSSASRPERIQMKDGRTMVCEMERPTGSHISERVCHIESSAADREANREVLDRPAVQLAK